jgi:hypothetical protein
VSVTDRRPPFRFAVRTRVGFDETDAQGIVYYGRYMPYFDRARVEYLRHLGLLRPGSSGAEFVMRAQHVESTTRRRGSTTSSRCSSGCAGSDARA